MKKILSCLRKAVTDFNMIADGDSIAVGLSGGKDSLALLKALKNYSLFSPQKFTVKAITIDYGFEGADFSGLKKFCDSLGVEYIIVPSEIYAIVFLERKEKNPCSLCSKLRRGALNAAVIENGCNKLALGHHMDDVIETFFLSMFYEGRLSTFQPVSYMDRSKVTLIRPLIYVEERTIRAEAKTLPVMHNPCPVNHYTQREYVKKLLKSVQKEIPFVRERIFGALSHPERENLWEKEKS